MSKILIAASSQHVKIALPRSRKATNIYRSISEHHQRHETQHNEQLGLHSLSAAGSSATDDEYRQLNWSDKKKSFKKKPEVFNKLHPTASQGSSSSEEELTGKIMAHGETTPTIDNNKPHVDVLANLHYQNISIEQMNTPEEIEFIENNIRENERLRRLSEGFSYFEDEDDDEEDEVAEERMNSIRSVSSESVVGVIFPKSA